MVDTGRAKSIVESWRAYLDEHRDEITAIQLANEATERRIAFADIQELADRIARPPLQLDARHHLERLRRVDGPERPQEPTATR